MVIYTTDLLVVSSSQQNDFLGADLHESRLAYFASSSRLDSDMVGSIIDGVLSNSTMPVYPENYFHLANPSAGILVIPKDASMKPLEMTFSYKEQISVSGRLVMENWYSPSEARSYEILLGSYMVTKDYKASLRSFGTFENFRLTTVYDINVIDGQRQLSKAFVL